LIVGLPLFTAVYWPQLAQAGVLPSEIGPPMIAIVESIYAAAILAPFVLTITYLCLRRYNPETRLLSWRRERPIRSIFLTVVFVAAAAELAMLIGLHFSADAPWYEYLWTIYGAAWIAWLLALRAAGVEQHSLSRRP
jgi:uncharacterized membrane protein